MHYSRLENRIVVTLKSDGPFPSSYFGVMVLLISIFTAFPWRLVRALDVSSRLLLFRSMIRRLALVLRILLILSLDCGMHYIDCVMLCIITSISKVMVHFVYDIIIFSRLFLMCELMLDLPSPAYFQSPHFVLSQPFVISQSSGVH
jgi:fumarate reductase subunit D